MYMIIKGTFFGCNVGLKVNKGRSRQINLGNVELFNQVTKEQSTRY